jgi:hypothetical protein
MHRLALRGEHSGSGPTRLSSDFAALENSDARTCLRQTPRARQADYTATNHANIENHQLRL